MVDDEALIARAKRWHDQDPDPDTREQLAALLSQPDLSRLRPLFEGRLAFGTAGLRAHLGVGPQRINRLLIRQSTLGLGHILKDDVASIEGRSVVVGFDGRRLSRELAHDTAGTLAAQGFNVQLMREPCPTPLVGFWVKHTQALAGIVITASHNPPAYNGYKVFWHTGTQIVPPIDAKIQAAILKIETAAQAPSCLSLSEGIATKRVAYLGDEVQKAYLAAIQALSVHPQTPARKTLRVAYTPLHGVGAKLAEAALAQAGFSRVSTVAHQREPDAAFPTTPSPNPEDRESMQALLTLAREQKAHLACANDPDADRLAAAIPTADGSFCALTGDEIGLLLADDRLRAQKAGCVVASTLVSSPLLAALGEHHGAEVHTTLTGFKWLAQVARQTALSNKRFAMAYEEALGFAVGDVVWDKDGISALVALAELAAAQHAEGKTLWDALDRIGTTVGFCASLQRTLPLHDTDSHGIMQRLAAANITHLGDFARLDTQDLRQPQPNHPVLGGLPPTFALWAQYGPRDPHASLLKPRIIVRPSGTEPKLKCYYDVVAPRGAYFSWRDAQRALGATLVQVAQAHQSAFEALL